MIPETNWEPTTSDINWQTSWLNMLKNDAVWGVPNSASAFKFNKTAKTFCLIDGNPEHETNRRIAKILKQLGYTETEKETGENYDYDV